MRNEWMRKERESRWRFEEGRGRNEWIRKEKGSRFEEGREKELRA